MWFLFFRYLNRHFLQQPFHCEIEHKIGLTCMTNGAVTCRVRLDRGGYVPGEAISIWATIANNSRVTIKHTRASLTEVKNLTFLGRKTRIKKWPPLDYLLRFSVHFWDMGRCLAALRFLSEFLLIYISLSDDVNEPWPSHFFLSKSIKTIEREENAHWRFFF